MADQQVLPGMPDNPEYTELSKIPRRAEGFQRMLHEDFQRQWDRLFGSDNVKPGDLEFAHLVSMNVAVFSQIYLLGVLRSINPVVANKATEVLADQLDFGDSLGEWAYQWREELEAGQPMTLLFEP
jgi:hypothetical protein